MSFRGNLPESSETIVDPKPRKFIAGRGSRGQTVEVPGNLQVSLVFPRFHDFRHTGERSSKRSEPSVGITEISLRINCNSGKLNKKPARSTISRRNLNCKLS